MNVETTEFTLKSDFDELDISVCETCPESGAKAVLQLAHGMCEHKERYLPFMRYMSERGYACVINDHRGHGKSVKSNDDLGYFYSGGANALVCDMELVTNYIRKKYPSLPVALFGHSMGSLAVRAYVKRHDRGLRALVVCGSPSENRLAALMKSFDDALIRRNGDKSRNDLINSAFLGAFQKNFEQEGVDNAWICSDRSVVDEFNNDSLCGFTFTLNGYRALLDLMTEAYSKKGWAVDNPKLPIRFVSGENDPCMVNRGGFCSAVKAMRDRGYTNVSARIFSGMRHEILNERVKNEVYADIFNFIESCV